jgi:membrane protease YdiL (CAAX protease family)
MHDFSLNTSEQTKDQPYWHHIGAFLSLTFGLTWLVDLIIYLHGGLAQSGVVSVIQLQMLLPAFSAIVLGLFFFPESPIYYKKPVGHGRWFYYYFLLFTGIYAVGSLGAWIVPASATLTPILTIVPASLGVLVLVVLRFVAGREGMSRVGLSGGNWRYWFLLGLVILAFYALQVVLNALFGLGPVRPSPLPSPPGMSLTLFWMVAAIQSVLLAPILAIVIVFGEEYGWRGYLQSELLKVGRVRGILLVGIIWGMWHWPLILMGFSYPGYPLVGLLLTVLFLLGLAIILGYAVLKTGSVLLAAYLHALNDQVTAFLVALGYKPFHPVFSFGVGMYGVVVVALVALLFLRDPIWRYGK